MLTSFLTNQLHHNHLSKNSLCYEKFVLRTPLNLMKCFVTPGSNLFTCVNTKVTLVNVKGFLMIIRSYICVALVIMSGIDLPSVPLYF